MHICGAEQPSKGRQGRPVRVQSVVHCRAEGAAVRVVEGPPKPGIFVRVERRLRGRPRTHTSRTHPPTPSRPAKCIPWRSRRCQLILWRQSDGRRWRGSAAAAGRQVAHPAGVRSHAVAAPFLARMFSTIGTRLADKL